MQEILEILMEGGAVKRYHTMRMPTQSVAEHTYRVIAVLRELTDDDVSKALLLAAHQHDVAEHFTGDLPFTAKREDPDLKSALQAAELRWMDKVGLHDYCDDLTDEEVKLLHAADRLEMGLFGCQAKEEGYMDGLRVAARILESFQGQEITPKTGAILGAIEKFIRSEVTPNDSK